MMDPNKTLRDLRLALDLKPAPSTSRFLAEQFTALDEWLTKGGFLPTDWERRRDGSKRQEGRSERDGL